MKVTQAQAIGIARAFASAFAMGWDEDEVAVSQHEVDAELCWRVATAERLDPATHWTERPVHPSFVEYYIAQESGECIAYGFGRKPILLPQRWSIGMKGRESQRG